MNTPKVTVIVPCYNYGRFLHRAVTSVLNQTFHDFEVIIVDDHSTDNTPEIAQSFTDNRVRYICQEKNVGQSENRNTAIRAARGELIAMLDADDWWDEKYLEEIVPVFSDSEVGAAYFLQKLHYEDGTSESKGHSQIVNGYAYNELFVTNFIGTPVVFRKTAIAERGYETDLSPHLNNLGVDWWILLDLSTKYKIVGINKHYYNYNCHGDSISKNVLKRIEADKIIQQRFLQEHPNLLSSKAINEAQYWSWFREGLYRRKSGEKWLACLAFLKASKMKPFDFLAYKSLGYTLLQR